MQLSSPLKELTPTPPPQFYRALAAKAKLLALTAAEERAVDQLTLSVQRSIQARLSPPELRQCLREYFSNLVDLCLALATNLRKLGSSKLSGLSRKALAGLLYQLSSYRLELYFCQASSNFLISMKSMHAKVLLQQVHSVYCSSNRTLVLCFLGRLATAHRALQVSIQYSKRRFSAALQQLVSAGSLHLLRLKSVCMLRWRLQAKAIGAESKRAVSRLIDNSKARLLDSKSDLQYLQVLQQCCQQVIGECRFYQVSQPLGLKFWAQGQTIRCSKIQQREAVFSINSKQDSQTIAQVNCSISPPEHLLGLLSGLAPVIQAFHQSGKNLCFRQPYNRQTSIIQYFLASSSQDIGQLFDQLLGLLVQGYLIRLGRKTFQRDCRVSVQEGEAVIAQMASRGQNSLTLGKRRLVLVACDAGWVVLKLTDLGFKLLSDNFIDLLQSTLLAFQEFDALQNDLAMPEPMVWHLRNILSQHPHLLDSDTPQSLVNAFQTASRQLLPGFFFSTLYVFAQGKWFPSQPDACSQRSLLVEEANGQSILSYPHFEGSSLLNLQLSSTPLCRLLVPLGSEQAVGLAQLAYYKQKASPLNLQLFQSLCRLFKMLIRREPKPSTSEPKVWLYQLIKQTLSKHISLHPRIVFQRDCLQLCKAVFQAEASIASRNIVCQVPSYEILMPQSQQLPALLAQLGFKTVGCPDVPTVLISVHGQSVGLAVLLEKETWSEEQNGFIGMFAEYLMQLNLKSEAECRLQEQRRRKQATRLIVFKRQQMVSNRKRNIVKKFQLSMRFAQCRQTRLRRHLLTVYHTHLFMAQLMSHFRLAKCMTPVLQAMVRSRLGFAFKTLQRVKIVEYAKLTCIGTLLCSEAVARIKTVAFRNIMAASALRVSCKLQAFNLLEIICRSIEQQVEQSAQLYFFRQLRKIAGEEERAWHQFSREVRSCQFTHPSLVVQFITSRAAVYSQFLHFKLELYEQQGFQLHLKKKQKKKLLHVLHKTYVVDFGGRPLSEQQELFFDRLQNTMQKVVALLRVRLRLMVKAIGRCREQVFSLAWSRLKLNTLAGLSYQKQNLREKVKQLFQQHSRLVQHSNQLRRIRAEQQAELARQNQVIADKENQLGNKEVEVIILKKKISAQNIAKLVADKEWRKAGMGLAVSNWRKNPQLLYKAFDERSRLNTTVLQEEAVRKWVLCLRTATRRLLLQSYREIAFFSFCPSS